MARFYNDNDNFNRSRRYANKKIDYPDVQIIFGVPSNISDYKLATSRFNIEANVIGNLYENIKDNYTFMPVPLLLRPYSRGYIKLKTADPDMAPAIVPNYFDDPRDLQILVRISLSHRHAFVA